MTGLKILCNDEEGMTFPLILLLVPLAIFIAGLILSIKPASCIKWQIKFYEKINWRMEPINMQMEIRNTKIMGLFLIGAAIATIIYFMFKV
jgi:hypothetical protein